MVMYSAYIGILLIAIARAQDHGVRLSNGDGKQGRVEVLNNGEWGTVCREGWDFYDALVTCRQLGFWWLASNGWKHEAGNGTGSVWLSNVGCLGSETSLEQCSNDGWVEHGCTGESGAAAVSCLDYNDLASSLRIASVRLKDGAGSIQAEGRVMVNLYTGYHERVRFVIHDQGWDLADADVICRQEGYHSAAKATTNSYFGMNRGSESSWFIDELRYLATEFACTGNESNILQCPFEGLFRKDYPRGHDAGVICNRVQEPEGFQIRLVNGTTAYEGRLEVFYNGTWGSVCKHNHDYELTSLETNVICGQLGLGYGKEAPQDERFGRSPLPVAIGEEFFCDGSESSLAQCSAFEFNRDPQNCPEADSYDASVICSGPIPESRSPIRFASDNIKELGHLLIYHDGRWGTICNKGWTMANSQVVCRELGLGPPLKTLFDSIDVGGPIFLDGVSCKGDEATLDQCQLGEWGKHTCTHSMDVATICDNGGVQRLPAATVTLIVASLTTLYCSM